MRRTILMLDRIEPRAQDESLATHYSLGDNERLGDRRSFTRKASERAA